MEAQIIDKQITSSGLTLTVEFTSAKTSYTKSFTTRNPYDGWIEDEIKAEKENVGKLQVYADKVTVIPKVVGPLEVK